MTGSEAVDSAADCSESREHELRNESRVPVEPLALQGVKTRG